MDQLVLFALLGVGSGALIAGVALAVVLTYRGSGTINLATGATAMVAGYGYWSARTGHFGPRLSAPLALGAALIAAVLVGVAGELLAFRPLRTASPVAKLAASLGVLLTCQAGIVLAFGTAAKPVPSVLPSDTVGVLGATVPVDRFILAAVITVITGGLWALYRSTRFGLATRAASEDEAAAMLAGLSPDRLSMANMVLASLVAGLVGVLSTSLVQLDATALPLQVVPALAAVVFARFTAFGTAAAVGLLLGIAQSLVYLASTQSWFPTDHGTPIPGAQQVLVFVAIVVAMLWRGGTLPVRGEPVDRRLPTVPAPAHLRRGAAIAAPLAAAALVVLPYDFRQALITSMIGALILMSYVVITGYAGQISLVQLSLSGIAGFMLSHLAVDAGIGFPLGPLIAIITTALVGVVIAAAAVRVRGVSLAVVTLAAAVAIEQFVFVNSTWGGGSSGAPVPSPHIFGVNLGPNASFRGLDDGQPSPIFGFVALAVTVALATYVANLPRTDFGRRMLAVRANERAAGAAGVNVRNVKLAAFAVSSVIAGTAGALYAYNFGSISATRFSGLAAVSLLAFAYIGGITRVSGAVLAGLLTTEALLPHALDTWFGVSGTWALLVGGLALIFTMRANPSGLAGATRSTPPPAPVAPGQP